jgi:hypothetical protein
MDLNLLLRRNRPADGDFGRECWLMGFYEPGGSTPVLAVTNHPGDVTYDGVTYTSYSCSTKPPQVDSESGLPSAELTVSNVLRAIQPSLAANDWYRGFTAEFIPYNDMQPAADYSSDVKQMLVISHKTDLQDVIFTLSVPPELLDEVPEDSYGGYTCRHRFRRSAGVYGLRCGYQAKSIVAVNIPGGPLFGRLSVEVTGHGYVTGDLIELSGVAGISPSLDDVFVVEKFNDDVFKLDGTDGADYTGPYTGGGLLVGALLLLLAALQRRSGRKGHALNVVDDLGVDVFGRTEDRQPWAAVRQLAQADAGPFGPTLGGVAG